MKAIHWISFATGVYNIVSILEGLKNSNLHLTVVSFTFGIE